MAPLRRLLANGTRAVLVAPPGAGKTTAVPLLLLDQPWLAGRRIVMLEPRRLATRAAAARMSHLSGTRLGELVGYQIRDERCASASTRIEVVTEGVLTRRLQRDPELPGVALVIFDEVHERNVFTDLGLALTLDIATTIRPDLRILAMSATLDRGRLADYLGSQRSLAAPVVESEGRSFPVDVRWAPVAPGPSSWRGHRGRRPPAGRRRVDVEPSVVDTVLAALARDDGDVLVFLPGIAEIMRARASLADDLAGRSIDVRPLAGALSHAEQDAALAASPPGRRRVVLATDIAETSLTVEGVGVVVDSGLGRAPRHDPATGLTRLTTVSISRDSADQRAGRAGRTGPGVAYRLWSQVEHAARPRHRQPEILSVDPAGVVLELSAWGGSPSLLDEPPRKAVEQARALLRSLGALDEHGSITPAGREMVRLPLHPRLARMVQARPTAVACLVAALLDERDVLRGRSDELPVDLAARLRLLIGGHDDRADRRAVDAVRRRAGDIAHRAGISFRIDDADPDAAGAALLLAYPDRLAGRRRRGQFQLRTGTAAMIPEHDPMADQPFVVAADLDGNRRRARIRRAAAVDADIVTSVLSDGVVEERRLVWDDQRDELVGEVERRLDGLRLGVQRRRPEPGADTTAALIARVRSTRLAALGWSPAASTLRGRIAAARRTLGAPWPDVGDEALLASLDEWLSPYLAGATGAADLRRIDVTLLLRAMLPWPQGAELDHLAPASLPLPSGRTVTVDYGGDAPRAAVRVQALYGVDHHPTVLGGTPVVLALLSPADRPIQVTADLPGFWSGSWRAVRKEMAGRYPKHDWPEHPETATPS